jgi:hypothetical protein
LVTTKGFTRNPAITHLNSPGVYQTDDLQDLEGKRKKSHSDSLQRPAYEEAAADLSRLTITVANPVLSTPRNTGCRLLISNGVGTENTVYFPYCSLEESLRGCFYFLVSAFPSFSFASFAPIPLIERRAALVFSLKVSGPSLFSHK